MRTLVTGGAGFIGSFVVERLLRMGHAVTVVDNLCRGRTEHVPKTVPLHMADITHEATMRVVQDFAPTAIVHLAAQMDVRASSLDPVHDANVNVLGTVRLLHAAVKCGVKTFVMATSGGAAYGDAHELPSSESCDVAPKSPYGASKICDEIYMQSFCRQHAMRGVALRLANVYGPRQNSSGEAGVVAVFAEAMLAGRTPVIFGDGLQTRDYVYVGDVADAFVCALQNSQATGIFNIGTGHATALNDVAATLKRLTHYAGHVLHAAAKADEVRHSALDATRANKALLWRSKTTLEEGLFNTVSAIQGGPAVLEPKNLALRLAAMAPPRD